MDFASCGIQNLNLRVIIGPMRSGKTTYIQSLTKCLEKVGQRVLLLNSSIDTRSHEDVTVTHDQRMMDCVKVKSLDDITNDMLNQYHRVIIDEAQFFTNLRPFVERCLTLSKKMIVSGLVGDVYQKPFGEINTILSLASKIEHRTGFCMVCGRDDAAFTKLRNGVSFDSQIHIGDEDYLTVCGDHI